MIRHSELSYLFACRNVNRGLQCFDNYARRCMMEEDSYHINSNLNRVKQFCKKICNPGPYQQGKWPYDWRG